MTDATPDLPSSATPAAASVVVAAFAGGVQDAPVLPAGAVAGLLDRVRRRLAAGGSPPVDGSHWPAGWPSPGQVLPAVAALSDLEAELAATLLEQGKLDADALRAIHIEFAAARDRVLASANAAPQTLQEALAARDRQLSIATHELRTPISSILLNLQMLERASRERGPLDAATVSRLLAVPSRQLRRLARMVGLLLDVAQVEAERLQLHPEPLDLCELVHDAANRLHELANANGCTICLDGCEPLAGMWDRLRLEQVVTNLLTNAIKYGGGRVEVGTRRADMALITVRDHGPGIPPEDRERIFQPFERLGPTAGEDGAGLGLYIVREIVRAHGGRIAIADAPDQGTVFTVSLPT